MAYIEEHWKCQVKLTEVFRRLDAKRLDLLMSGSGYDHESNGRTKRIKLDSLAKLEIDLVDLDWVNYNDRNWNILIEKN